MRHRVFGQHPPGRLISLVSRRPRALPWRASSRASNGWSVGGGTAPHGVTALSMLPSGEDDSGMSGELVQFLHQRNAVLLFQVESMTARSKVWRLSRSPPPARSRRRRTPEIPGAWHDLQQVAVASTASRVPGVVPLIACCLSVVVFLSISTSTNLSSWSRLILFALREGAAGNSRQANKRWRCARL